MSSRASGGTLAASLITAAIIGFAGGAYVGTQSGGADAAENPEETTAATTPGGDSPDDQPTESPSQTPDETGLSLSAEPVSISPGQRIDLNVTIDPPEAGVVVRVQRSIDGGPWEDFPSAENPIEWTTGEDGTFGGNIETGRTGLNSIRVIRADDDSVVSNEVEITVG